jgi:shikimate dehydrogenase
MKTLRLGLIGSNIAGTQSPALQILCGLSVHHNVTYDLLIPAEQNTSFQDMFARCVTAKYDGINVTYPYKEEVMQFAKPGDAAVTRIGAANTVKFTELGPHVFNTDYSGFIAAWKAKWGNKKPGRVLLAGAGGVGRAISFALAELGAENVALHDSDESKATALAEAATHFSNTTFFVAPRARLADLSEFDGVINGTPIGMTGVPGSPLPAHVKGNPSWAFDAVYTPDYTPFRAQMEAKGADFLSGYELYFHQGVQGFKIFSGMDVDRQDWVRTALRGG